MVRSLPIALAAAASLAGIAHTQDRQPRPAPVSKVVELGLGSELDWIADPEVHVDGRRAQRSLDGEIDRMALLDQAVARAKETGRLVLWVVPRIVENGKRGAQMYRAPILHGYLMQLLFEDPDLVALAKSRFVPLSLNVDEALAARFDLRPLDFVEPAIVFVDGDGQLVHYVERIRTFDPHWFVELMRRVLVRAGLNGGDDAVTDPRQALDEGRYARAAKLIAQMDDEPGEQAYLEAILQRRQRALAPALLALGVAREARTVPRTAIDAELLRLLLLSGEDMGMPTAAVGDGPRAAETLYLLGFAALRRGDEDAARAAFEGVVAKWPATAFGRRAAANLTLGDDERPIGASFSGFETMRWLDDQAYRGLPRDTVWHGPDLPLREMAIRAMEHLLSLQRDDGGFKDSRYAYWPSPKITPNAWIAITALAATALLEHRDIDPERIPTARVDAAIALAESYLFDPAHIARGENEDVYADTYRLLFLARKTSTVPDAARAAIVERMNQVVRESKERQKDNGFFAHEYANAFCTGAMLWGLIRAREAGAEVPEEMISRGRAALLSARAEDGSYGYSGTAKQRQSSLKDASERMPVCEGILYALGASDATRLRFAFDNYWANIERIEKVRRNDFHSDGELAGFFFFHGMFHASEIWARLPPELRGDSGERFLDLLRRIPEVDGSFIDSHEIGRSYATAMALLVMANLREE